MDIVVPYSLWYFSVFVLVQLHQFTFLVTQIQFLGDYKIVENGLSQYFSPIFRVWVYLSHVSFGAFFCVNIGPATPVYISHDSDSVS